MRLILVRHGQTSANVNRALDMSQNGVDMLNKSVLKVVPEIFSLDIEKGIKNPIGMAAKRLEVRSHIFTINSNTINNILTVSENSTFLAKADYELPLGEASKLEAGARFDSNKNDYD